MTLSRLTRFVAALLAAALVAACGDDGGGDSRALVIGAIAGLAMTARVWQPVHGGPGPGRWGWRISRFTVAVPRSVHEVVFGLLLVNVLGLDPLVAVLAIGVPFGAVTAKVFSELLEEDTRRPRAGPTGQRFGPHRGRGLRIYNLGVLGRLQAEVVENVDERPGRARAGVGADRMGRIAYATAPAVAGRFVALGLHR